MSNPWAERAEAIDNAMVVVADVCWYSQHFADDDCTLKRAEKAYRRLQRLRDDLVTRAENYDQRALIEYQIDRSVEQIIDT